MKKLLKRMFNPDGKDMNSKENDMIEKLILAGALEIAAIDSEDGSILYSFTPKIQEVMPDLYHEHINKVNAELLNLWERGYVNIDFLSDDPKVTPAEKSFNNEEISILNKQDRWYLEELKRLAKFNPKPE